MAKAIAGLKAEVEELTVSHDLEVERLQERLGQLQTVQDKLQLTLREKRAEHEKAWADTEQLEAQKVEKLKEQSASPTSAHVYLPKPSRRPPSQSPS